MKIEKLNEDIFKVTVLGNVSTQHEITILGPQTQPIPTPSPSRLVEEPKLIAQQQQ